MVVCGSCRSHAATFAVEIEQGSDVEPDRWWIARCANPRCLEDVPGVEVWREPMSRAAAELITGDEFAETPFGPMRSKVSAELARVADAHRKAFIAREASASIDADLGAVVAKVAAESAARRWAREYPRLASYADKAVTQ